MLVNIGVLSFGVLIAFVLFWSAPSDRPHLRQTVLIAVSAVLVLCYSLGGFLFCLFLASVPLVAQSCFARWRNVWSFWLLVAAALSPLVGVRLLAEQSFFLSFGVAFATVKSLGLVMIAYSGRQKLVWRDVFMLIYFFPLFTVGPVERLNTFAHTNFSTRFNRRDTLYGIYRILVGLFLVLFVCTEILDPLRSNWFGRSHAAIEGFDRADALGLIIASFLYTYLNFEGFSAIAIGLSRLFGLKVIENFDRPLMVTNIADFWKRYHISMGNWINQFLFFPIVLLIKRPWASYLSTVIAFILFGLWHSFDLNYLAWGFANGVAVASVHFGISRKVFPLVKSQGALKRIVGLVSGAATLLFISWIQTFANLENFETAILLSAKLIGG